jgi:hypothetical protein
MTLAYLQLLRVLRQRIPSPRLVRSAGTTISKRYTVPAARSVPRPYALPYSWFTAAQQPKPQVRNVTEPASKRFWFLSRPEKSWSTLWPRAFAPCWRPAFHSRRRPNGSS